MLTRFLALVLCCWCCVVHSQDFCEFEAGDGTMFDVQSLRQRGMFRTISNDIATSDQFIFELNFCEETPIPCHKEDASVVTATSSTQSLVPTDEANGFCLGSWGVFGEGTTEYELLNDDNAEDGFRVIISGGDTCDGDEGTKSTRIDVACSNDISFLANYIDDCTLQAFVRAPEGCGVGNEPPPPTSSSPDDSPDDGGSISGVGTFFLVVFIIITASCMAGCGYKYTKQDARGIDALPFIEEYRQCGRWLKGNKSEDYGNLQSESRTDRPVGGAGGAGGAAGGTGPQQSTLPTSYHDQL